MRYNLNGDVKVTVANAIKSYTKGRNAVQNAAVKVLIHAVKHGDYSQAQVLCDGVGNKQLVTYFVDFGGLKVEGNKFVGWSGAAYIERNLTPAKGEKQGKAQSTMYWDWKKPNIWAGHDDLQAAKALIAKHNAAVKRVEDDPTCKDKVHFHPELITAMEEAIDRIEAA